MELTRRQLEVLELLSHDSHALFELINIYLDPSLGNVATFSEQQNIATDELMQLFELNLVQVEESIGPDPPHRRLETAELINVLARREAWTMSSIDHYWYFAVLTHTGQEVWLSTQTPNRV